MKAVAGVLGVVAPIVTILATLTRLRWHKIKEAPGPTPPQTTGQKVWRITAAVWLIAVAVIAVILVFVLVLPAIVRLFT